MTDTAIVARIQSLLAKARDAGATEAEAAAAASAAERLLARHCLTMADVTRPDIRGVMSGIRYLEPWVRNMATQAARLYGCEPLIDDETSSSGKTYRTLRLFGRQHSTEVAVSMIQYLIDTVVRMSREYSTVRREQLGFQRGAGERLAHRLWGIRQRQIKRAVTPDGQGDGTSLVVTEQSESREWVQSNLEIRRVRQRSSDTSGRAAADGWHAAARVGLGDQIAESAGASLQPAATRRAT